MHVTTLLLIYLLNNCTSSTISLSPRIFLSILRYQRLILFHDRFHKPKRKIIQRERILETIISYMKKVSYTPLTKIETRTLRRCAEFDTYFSPTCGTDSAVCNLDSSASSDLTLANSFVSTASDILYIT